MCHIRTPHSRDLRQCRTGPVPAEAGLPIPRRRSTVRGSPADGEAGWILEIIRGLPDAYRETLILRLVEGMTGPEIAERTGLTAGSVRVNLHRGMKQLREKLAGRTAP